MASDTRPRPLPENTSETVDCETSAQRATSTLVTRWMADRSMLGNATTRAAPGLTDARVIRSMLIRMTDIGTQLTALVAVVGPAAGGLLGTDADRTPATPTALVIDVSAAHDGREL